jgi:hypothetical protein
LEETGNTDGVLTSDLSDKASHFIFLFHLCVKEPEVQIYITFSSNKQSVGIVKINLRKKLRFKAAVLMTVQDPVT